MNWLILGAGVLAGITSLVHLLAGEKTVVRPFLEVPMDVTVQRTLHACWHLVTFFLVASASTLVYSAFADPVGVRPLVRFIAINYLLFAAIFLTLTLCVRWNERWKRLPQWILLAPVGVLALLGAA
jgi:hypothetical protein